MQWANVEILKNDFSTTAYPNLKVNSSKESAFPALYDGVLGLWVRSRINNNYDC